ncbi:hypothetical protein [Planctomicrobium sp. SH664]|uniref:hypothetical protein n=1 Tax=Planctomicrobium sp. SH664 TaxID=3448125 RepID=UPI003F5BCFCE
MKRFALLLSCAFFLAGSGCCCHQRQCAPPPCGPCGGYGAGFAPVAPYGGGCPGGACGATYPSGAYFNGSTTAYAPFGATAAAPMETTTTAVAYNAPGAMPMTSAMPMNTAMPVSTASAMPFGAPTSANIPTPGVLPAGAYSTAAIAPMPRY